MDSYFTSINLSLEHDHWMNIAYAFLASCVIYKMVVISVLAARAPRIIRRVMKASAVFVGTIIAMKALNRFEGGDVAQWLDIVRESSWCALLFTGRLLNSTIDQATSQIGVSK